LLFGMGFEKNPAVFFAIPKNLLNLHLV